MILNVPYVMTEERIRLSLRFGLLQADVGPRAGPRKFARFGQRCPWRPGFGARDAARPGTPARAPVPYDTTRQVTGFESFDQRMRDSDTWIKTVDLSDESRGDDGPIVGDFAYHENHGHVFLASDLVSADVQRTS